MSLKGFKYLGEGVYNWVRLFNAYLLSFYFKLGIVLGLWDILVYKVDNDFCFRRIYGLWEFKILVMCNRGKGGRF